MQTLGMLILPRLFGRKIALLFIVLFPRRFGALTERLCLSSSPQAFRERLEPKLSSLAVYASLLFLIPQIIY
ncbi:hypothetical protein, partial [Ruminococcus albus]|uniref:hypothetical protein n=1 Tax=Ruminococcus albus TaxID=1264 RepID=UPI001A9911EA